MIYKCLVALGFVAAASAQAAPPNDRCIAREILEPFTPVDGNNTYANFDFPNQGICGPRSDRGALWYEVRGRGARVTVKVCTNNEVITDFGVFQKCNSQLCEGAPPQTFEPADCFMNETVDYSWIAVDDFQYFVQVRADVNDGEGSNFTIWYEDEFVTPSPTLAPISGGSSGFRIATSIAALVGGLSVGALLL